MSYSLDYSGQRIAAEASADARAVFIRKTYGHLAGALLAFTILETLLIQLTPADVMIGLLSSQVSRLILMVGFIGVAWLANYWALSGATPAKQYAGLSLYVVAEAVLFLPLMFIATQVDKEIIPKAGIMTLAIVAGLTFTVFTTRQDFSFLGPIVSIGFCLALGFLFAGLIFGFNIGNWFAFAMVALASCSVLYQTSNVLHRYRTDQYVAASLSLFASIVLLFWYIVQILLVSRRN